MSLALNTIVRNNTLSPARVANALDGILINSAIALVDASTMDLTETKHTLASSSATRTFTITYTFPAAALCVSEGVASGDNTLALSGVSGDKYIIAIKKMGSAYYVVAKNFGQ
jgi:hypothetical protein